MSRIQVPLIVFALVSSLSPLTTALHTNLLSAAQQGPGLPPRDPTGAAAPSTARLSGRVLAAATGLPLRRAQVTLTATDGGQQRRTARTDLDGRYDFRDLPPGRFTVAASKGGFLSLQFGQRRPYEQGKPVVVAKDQHVERVDFALPRGSAITVRVTDDSGEPFAGAQVAVQRYQYHPDGQRQLVGVATGTIGLASTDDRGEFRAYGLMPGDYVISASDRTVLGALSDPAQEGFSTTFYPGTLNPADAQAIALGIGEEIALQFALSIGRVTRVSGTVVDSQGRPAAGSQLMVVERRINGITSYGAGTVAADGTFTIRGVSPGDRWIDVRPPSTSSADGEFASVQINVPAAADIEHLRIVTGKGSAITGRIVLESGAAVSGILRGSRVAFSLASGQIGLSTGAASNGEPDAAGEFRVAGVLGRGFLDLRPMPQGWAVKSVTLDNTEITDVPLDVASAGDVSGVIITLTDRLTTVRGRVTDRQRLELQDYVVVVQPADDADPLIVARAIRVMRPDTNAQFETRGLRPGRYLATAIEFLEQGREFAPEFRQRLRQAGREFSLAEGEQVTLDLLLSPDL